jgi:hypothetical protein
MTSFAIACALALAPAQGAVAIASSGRSGHPANADVYVELPDLAAVERAYASAPLVQFCSDADVSKLGELLAGLGADVPAIVKRGTPRLAADPAASAFSVGELRSLSVSVHGIDREAQDPPEFEKRAEILVACEFASEAAATRMASALVDSGWLAPATPIALPTESAAAAGAPSSAPPTAAPTVEISGKRVDVARYRWSALGVALDAWCVQSGSRWWLGAGRATPTALAERLAGARPSLATGAALFGPEPSASTSGVLVARLRSDLVSVPSLPGSEDQPWLGALTSVLLPFAGSSGTWRIALQGSRFVTEARYVRRAPPTAFEQLLGPGPLPTGSAASLPPEAVGAWVFPLRADAAGSALRMLLPSDDARVTSDPASKERRARIDASFAKALGTKASIALLPFAGISPLPRVLATIELRDRAAFEAALSELEAELLAIEPDAVVSKRTYRKVPMYAFTKSGASEDEPSSRSASAGPFGLPIGDPTANLRPTIAVLGDRVLVGLASSYVRAEIQRLEKAGDATAQHALAAEGRIPADALEASSMDWGGLLGKVYDMARGFVPMLAQQGGPPIDAAQLQPASKLMRFFAPGFSITRRLEDGTLHTRSESSFGPEMLFVIAAAAKGIESSTDRAATSALLPATTTLVPTQPVGATTQTQPGETKPAPNVPAKSVERDASIAALRSVKTGLAVYFAQNGGYPERLAVLTESTTDFPNGFLDAREVPKDGWSRDLHYQLDVGTNKFRLWSLGADGLDQNGFGDDIALP